MSQLGRRDLALLLIGAGANGSLDDSLGGLTRLQKYLYLLEEEEKVKPVGDGFEFVAYKAGPYSAKLYDDLEFLENLGLIQSEVVAESSEAEVDEVEKLSFEELMGDDAATADAYEERRFRLTEKGLEHIKKLVDSPEYAPIIERIRRVKSKYGRYSLNDLLYYVYTKYPTMAIESDIREKVLGRGKR